MDTRTVVPETARIARVEAFPAEGDDLPAIAETALLARRADGDIWHRQLGHLNTDNIVRMVRNGMVKGMEINGNSRAASESDKEIEEMLTISPKTPTPTLASIRPKRIVHAPIRDDDPRYPVSSYSTRERLPRRAKVAQANTSGDPRTYVQAMAHAAEWEAACEAERRAFERMGVYEVVPRQMAGREIRIIGHT
jgi:hypothetical protein